MDVSSAHPLHHCTYPRPNTCMHTRMHMHMHICTILRCVSNAVTGCANFAVISALLFGGAHALTLGRPKPFAPDASSVEAYGEEVTTVAIWCAYGLNVLAQSLALGIIITSNPNPNHNPNHSPSHNHNPNPKPKPNPKPTHNPNPNQASSSRPSLCGSCSVSE